MASIAMMVGGAVVNALDFSVSNFLFSSMRGSEQKRHNKALEQLKAAQSQWTRRRMERLDFIHDELRKHESALDFSRSNFLFSSMRGSEQKRHNKALEQLKAAQSQ